MRSKKLLSFFLAVAAVICLAGIFLIGKDMSRKSNLSEPEASSVQPSITPQPTATPEPAATPQPEPTSVPAAVKTEQTVTPDGNAVTSQNSILIDLSTNTIVAEKDSQERISPASMTKILTILVAAEHMGSPDDMVTITSDMTGYCLTNGCSAAGFVDGETVPVRDLFYGTILPSGGEAAAALAIYTAGSLEAFTDLMNEKLGELGLSDSAHFTNCVGIYDENHYCTAYDMAMILKAAVENDFCREMLSAKVYTTTATEKNPQGIILSNWFLRRIEDKDCGGQVVCAKTGYVQQSGDCAASYEISPSGKPYICVTVNAHSSWRCIYDHVAMYKQYAS